MGPRDSGNLSSVSAPTTRRCQTGPRPVPRAGRSAHCRRRAHSPAPRCRLPLSPARFRQRAYQGSPLFLYPIRRNLARPLPALLVEPVPRDHDHFLTVSIIRFVTRRAHPYLVGGVSASNPSVALIVVAVPEMLSSTRYRWSSVVFLYRYFVTIDGRPHVLGCVPDHLQSGVDSSSFEIRAVLSRHHRRGHRRCRGLVNVDDS